MNKILDNQYYDFLIDNTLIPSLNTRDEITRINSRSSLLHVYKENMEACDLGRYPYHYFPALYTPTSLISTGPPAINKLRSKPRSDLLGLGVVIGIIDTGIDYRHPAFANPDGSTRILSIWDQSDQSGKPPKGFSYGSEYGKNHINVALKSESPFAMVPVTDENGHGTAIASIIAGSVDKEQDFCGIVPHAKLAVVKLKEAKQNLKRIFFAPEEALCYQESDIMLGIRYLLSVSRQYSHPLILCIALGSSQGAHDGRDSFCAYLDQVNSMPRVLACVSAGNEASRKRHCFSQLEQAPFSSNFQLEVGEADKTFSMEIWPFPPGKICLEIVSPNQETIESIYPSFDDCHQFVMDSGKGALWINNILLEGDTGDQVIVVRFYNPVKGIWNFRIQSIENEPFSFHVWLPSGKLISRETYFPEAVPDTTVTCPGNARFPLTVAAYKQTDGSILEESGRGYALSKQVVPDIAAPGYELPCAIPEGAYASLTGTGAACAYAAGTAAIVMEWSICQGNQTAITGNQLNHMIIRGAKRSGEYTYPNNLWGYGQIDIFSLFERIYAPSGLEM